MDLARSFLFGYRKLVLLIFLILTALFLFSASHLELKAGFAKLLPLEHEYTKTFLEYREDFGGANRILIALETKEDDIFNPEFFSALQQITHEISNLEGIDRSQVKSLFTPNVRYTEIIAGGFSGDTVIPANFEATPSEFTRVRGNIFKSGQLGRLVSGDFKAAMISAEILEIDPKTNEKIDYVKVAEQLENLRSKYENKNHSVFIIGFSKLAGELSDGLKNIVHFFLFTFAITAILLYLFTRSVALTSTALVSAVIAVIWQLGLMSFVGLNLDPLSIIVCFLVFAIGISHGVQMVNAFSDEYALTGESLISAKNSFSRLILPGCVALVSDTIGFLTILLINIAMIREIAIAASLGVMAILVINLLLLPVLLSYVRVPAKQENSAFDVLNIRYLWESFSIFTQKRFAIAAISCALVFLFIGIHLSQNLAVGDVHPGAPELRQESRYNQDIAAIMQRFTIGIDVLSVMVEATPEACVDYDTMEKIDQVSWKIEQLTSVQGVASLPTFARKANVNWNEGNLKWTGLPRNKHQLAASVQPFDTDTGLLNFDCSIMPIYAFLKDHKAETLTLVVEEVAQLNKVYGNESLNFRLASSNGGLMAATNETISAAQLPILLNVFAAIIILCLIAFRSWRAMLIIILPLSLISVLTYALMAIAGIGLKVATLPVVALGAGIGVDYAIYIYSHLRRGYCEGISLQIAYQQTLQKTGKAVLFTALTLACGVGVWIFSPLKFQADMGLLLTFMFIANMLATLALLPALSVWLLKPSKQLGIS